MTGKNLIYLAAGALCVLVTQCTSQTREAAGSNAIGKDVTGQGATGTPVSVKNKGAEACTWRDALKAELPLMGHRNWIVITDMAYPLQTKPGIQTLYAEDSYMDILTHVYREVKNAPHIKPVIYQDKELSFLSDNEAQGIDILKKEMEQLLGNQVVSVPHEELIARLDEVSQMFKVIIIKSNLTIPYTSTFFELDCAYWEASKQQALDERMKLNK